MITQLISKKEENGLTRHYVYLDGMCLYSSYDEMDAKVNRERIEARQHTPEAIERRQKYAEMLAKENEDPTVYIFSICHKGNAPFMIHGEPTILYATLFSTRICTHKTLNSEIEEYMQKGGKIISIERQVYEKLSKPSHTINDSAEHIGVCKTKKHSIRRGLRTL